MKNAKFIVAIVTAALTGVVNVLPVGSVATQYVNFALTVLGAIAVYVVPNAQASRPSAPASEPYHRPGV